MNYKIAQTKGYIAPSPKHLLHSAKGTTWENHKYVKVEDGKYFYPSNYEGGRHSDVKETPENTVQSREPVGWDTKLFSSFESNLRGANGKLDPKAVQQMLLFGKDKDGKGYDNFKVALGRAGIDTSKIDENSLNLMRYKVLEHYKNEFAKEKDNFDKEGNRIKDRKESSAKASSNATASTTKKKATSKSIPSVEAPKATVKTSSSVPDTPKRRRVINSTGKTQYSPVQSSRSKRKK